MANFSFNITSPYSPTLGNYYQINVSGTIDVGSVFTVNSTSGVIAQYTAVTGDDAAAVIAGLYAATSVTKYGPFTGFYVVFMGSGAVTSTPLTSPPSTTPTVTPTTVPYGRRFQVTFDPREGGSFGFKPRYRLDIFQKNYTGGVKNLKGGPSGFKHLWQTDEPKPGIKGSSLTAGILNEGNLPLSTFLSVDDDEFKFQFYWIEVVTLIQTRDNLLFEGFLVQDDCSEVLIDSTHELILQATDGLGLLKDVALDKAPEQTSLLEKIPLLTIIKKCLSVTGLELPTNIYCNIFEKNQLHDKPFQAVTLVDPSSFLKDNIVYDDCYSILEKILERSHLTLLQAEGVWNIVRWDELRYYSNNIPGYKYDKDFNLTGTITLADALQIDRNADPAPDTFPETGLLNKVFRPFLYAKEKFDYKQPPHILRNDDLQTLGNELRHYTTGSGADLKKIAEYEMPWWYDEAGGATAEYFIRVIKDEFDNEIERYAVVKYDSIVSYPIEASKGDLLSFSFQVRAMYPTGGNSVFAEFIISLTDGSQTVFVQKLPNNIPPLGEKPTTWGNSDWFYEYANGDYQEQWTDITIATTLPIPFDGKLTVTLTQYPKNPLNNVEIETHYKDLRFQYTARINESTKIIGQTHKSEQVATIKQNEERDIYIDDSPRNFIAGTLFLDQLNGIIQKRTAQWHRKHIPLEKRKMGNITTLEQEQWRSKSRTTLEGNFIGLLHNNKHSHVSMLSVFRCSIKTELAELNFVPGRMEIDYKNDSFSGTLHEMYKDGEADITSTYEFKNIYDTK